MKRIFTLLMTLILILPKVYAVDASKLLAPEQAFIPQVNVTDLGVNVQFQITDGYYLYQNKFTATTEPNSLLATPQYSLGKPEEDEFFGKQMVYHNAAQINWPYSSSIYTLTISYQGCAEVGVCYSPAQTTFQINGNGLFIN